MSINYHSWRVAELLMLLDGHVLLQRGPCFHPTLVQNRQHPNLICALEKIIGNDVTIHLVNMFCA